MRAGGFRISTPTACRTAMNISIATWRLPRRARWVIGSKKDVQPVAAADHL